MANVNELKVALKGTFEIRVGIGSTPIGRVTSVDEASAIKSAKRKWRLRNETVAAVCILPTVYFDPAPVEDWSNGQLLTDDDC
jgi:hypothetical protein